MVNCPHLNYIWNATQKRSVSVDNALKAGTAQIALDIFTPHINDMLLNSSVDLIFVDTITHNPKDPLQGTGDRIVLGNTGFPRVLEISKNRHMVCTVAVKNFNIRTILHTIAHELTHACQGLTGKLVIGDLGNSDTITLWKHRAFCTKMFEYEKFPWEIEANEVSDNIMKGLDSKLELETGIILDGLSMIPGSDEELVE